jgi:hypothetical protein
MPWYVVSGLSVRRRSVRRATLQHREKRCKPCRLVVVVDFFTVSDRFVAPLFHVLFATGPQIRLLAS